MKIDRSKAHVSKPTTHPDHKENIEWFIKTFLEKNYKKPPGFKCFITEDENIAWFWYSAPHGMPVYNGGAPVGTHQTHAAFVEECKIFFKNTCDYALKEEEKLKRMEEHEAKKRIKIDSQ